MLKVGMFQLHFFTHHWNTLNLDFFSTEWLLPLMFPKKGEPVISMDQEKLQPLF